MNTISLSCDMTIVHELFHFPEFSQYFKILVLKITEKTKTLEFELRTNYLPYDVSNFLLYQTNFFTYMYYYPIHIIL